MQQDAHEFLNHLLNTCADILLGLSIWFVLFCIWFLLAEKKEEKEKHDKQRNKSNSISINHNHIQCNGDGQSNRISNTSENSIIEDTWIHELFQGTLVSTTKCLNCETVWEY
jgi:hypothetical protein